ncbi:cellulose biosynthesis protein BcsQ [Alkalibacillus flavidus]|uniref:Cellulose biosynthesis protein BcsQ n=1 Tax=Alkalibacillus flavidus TaxID=546021 RepID=A0ABV2L0E3_9BACI
MNVLLFGNYKGGCSKTVNSVIMSNLLAEDYKVLFIDLDSQMNGTEMLTKKMEDTEKRQLSTKNIHQAIKQEDILENIVEVNENLDLVPGHEKINTFERVMTEKKIYDNQYLFFKYFIEQLKTERDYDFVILDMSPSKSALNIAVMATATHHIVTTTSEKLSVEMIDTYMNDIKAIQNKSPFESELLGISVTMTDPYNAGKNMLQAMTDKYSNLLFDTVLKRKTQINHYTMYGFPNRKQNGELYAKDSVMLRLHKDLRDEILARLGNVTSSQAGDTND